MERDDRDLDGLFGRALHALSASTAVPAQHGGDVKSSARRASEDAIPALADEFLARGLEIKRWWDERAPGGRFAERFDLGRTFNEATESYGFFDTAEVAGEPMPVMGNFQEMFYDRPKSATTDRREAAEWTARQLRRFVLRYFMRVSDFREPQGFTDTWRPPLSTMLSLLSWCPEGAEELRGFGFQQLWFKDRAGGVHRFPDEERHAIVDLRELGKRYEWIVLKVRIFDFEFTFSPLGADGPQLVLPLQEDSYLVLSADLVERQDHPEPGVLGRYGLGYAFIREPGASFLGYGPGRFDAAIELIRFHVSDDGSIRVPMVFVANRPERVSTVDLDPVGWGMEMGGRMADLASFGMAGRWIEPMRRLADAVPRPRLRFDPVLGYVSLANGVSGDMAADYLCIDRKQLEKQFLVKHYMQHYQTIAGSLATWRRVADWCDEESLPAWVKQGRLP
jgi:hypothetical protein